MIVIGRVFVFFSYPSTAEAFTDFRPAAATAASPSSFSQPCFVLWLLAHTLRPVGFRSYARTLSLSSCITLCAAPSVVGLCGVSQRRTSPNGLPNGRPTVTIMRLYVSTQVAVYRARQWRATNCLSIQAVRVTKTYRGPVQPRRPSSGPSVVRSHGVTCERGFVSQLPTMLRPNVQ